MVIFHGYLNLPDGNIFNDSKLEIRCDWRLLYYFKPKIRGRTHPFRRATEADSEDDSGDESDAMP